ncbi:MAG: nucleoside monophosphate kinase [Patescibacteria group bacterium]
MTSDKRIVIGLVGRKGSGKGTVARLIKDRYGATIYRFSDLLRDILDSLYIDKSRDNLIHLSEILRDGFGQTILRDAMVKQVQQDPSRLVVIDGIRRLDDLSRLDELGDFHLVDVTAPIELRYERIQQRVENAGESTDTMEQFQATETAPTEITIADVEARAQEKIENLGSYDDLATKVDDLVNRIKHA